MPLWHTLHPQQGSELGEVIEVEQFPGGGDSSPSASVLDRNLGQLEMSWMMKLVTMNNVLA